MRKWTLEEESELIALIEHGFDWQNITALTGRSKAAIVNRLWRLKYRTTETGYSVKAVEVLLGVGRQVVTRWVQNGFFRATPIGRSYVLQWDDLLRFLQDERYWHLWDPNRITDKALQEWADDLRDGLAFYRPHEVAARYYLSRTAVNRAIQRNEVKAVRYGRDWFIRSDWAAVLAKG